MDLPKYKNKSCDECKFCELEDGICFYEARVRAIYHYSEAELCKHYEKGVFDWDKLEKTNYR